MAQAFVAKMRNRDPDYGDADADPLLGVLCAGGQSGGAIWEAVR